MLRKFLFVSLAVITLASCEKDKDDAPAYYLSAKVDGTKKDFNTAIVAQKEGDATNGYSVYIVAAGGTATSPLPAFDLTISDDVAITAKTYTATQIQADGSYTPDSQSSYDSDTDFTITVSSITATEIKGVFSGKVEDASGGFKTITEGTFSAKFQ